MAGLAADINIFSEASVPAGIMNAWAAPFNVSILNETGFTVANKALVFNEAGFTVANKALVFNEAGFTAANKAAVCNHTNLTSAVLNAICDNANISTATIKAILDTETVIVSSQLGAMLEGTQLSLANAATVCNAKYTDAQINAACDNAIMSTARIKAILDTEVVTTASKLGACLEGTQLSLANAATVCNAKYTDAQKASAFDNAIMSYARSASIFNEAGFTAANKAMVFNEAGFTVANKALVFNEAGFTVANKALVFNEAGFTVVNKALVFREAGLSIANINAIIIHANITDDNAQQILSEITKANRDLTSADNIYELLDDWDDNKLTSRNGAGTTSTGFTNLFAHKDKFRPVWTTVANSPAASGGELVLPFGAHTSAPSTFVTGTWECVLRNSATGGNNSSIIYFLGDGTDTAAYTYKHEYTPRLLLWVSTDGDLIAVVETQPTTNTAYKVTRDASGNFEIFFGGVSKGTALNTRFTSSTKIGMRNAHTAGPTVYIDDLKVY
jgi:hypothetical protein